MFLDPRGSESALDRLPATYAAGVLLVDVVDVDTVGRIVITRVGHRPRLAYDFFAFLVSPRKQLYQRQSASSERQLLLF